MRLLLDQLNPTLDSDMLAHTLLATFQADIYRQILLSADPAARTRLIAALDRIIAGLVPS